MITEQELIDAGYKTFKDNMSRADVCYQKRVWDSTGSITLYFINLYKYDNHWELNMAFDCDGGTCPYMWIKGSINDQSSLKDIEHKASKIFEALSGIPYEWRK